MVVAENVMKWDATEPTKGTFTFAAGDQIVDFAEANGMKVRGHNLLWHQQLPGWLSGGKYTRDELLDILHNHIKNLVEHYKGRVETWDVVNEAVGDGSGSLRSDLWLTTIGPDYIEQAFRFAHEADPKAKLYYNDYGGEGMNTKSDAIYELVKGLKEKGVPIDGVGLQMHIGIASFERPKLADLAANMERIAALGLEVQITEMDVKIQNGSGTDNEKLAAQAQVYADTLRTCLQQKACTALLAWGLIDKYSWIPGFTGKPDAPLLFDDNYQPKPAYTALLDVLSQK
jgi:endo-1,4-beta-xylanase